MTTLCFIDTETTPACADCGATGVRLCVPGRMSRKPNESREGAVCDNCRQKRRRRAAGVQPRVTLTDEQRRTYAAAWARKRHEENRQLALAAYGGTCACCGESEAAFLAIDHIDGGGNEHRRSLSGTGRMVGSSNFYAWLRRNDHPDGFTVLCHNCNFAKSHAPSGCPHRIGALS
jgi:hypothetical protein